MRHERKVIRLRNFDYRSKSSHFVTICTGNREYYFGKIMNGEIEYSAIGLIAKQFWECIPDHFPHAVLDAFVIMPNHVHAIIKIRTCHGMSEIGTCHGDKIGTCHGMSLFNKFGRPVAGSVSMVVNHYKAAVKRWCNKNGYESFMWQSRFYDQIINDEKGIETIRKYIKNNPRNWTGDEDDFNDS